MGVRVCIQFGFLCLLSVYLAMNLLLLFVFYMVNLSCYCVYEFNVLIFFDFFFGT